MTSLYTTIADTLQTDIANGVYPPGSKLPPEKDLAERFGVNRHTVRHGLQVLIEAGLVYSRRGAGSFVSQKVTQYPIGKRVRFHRNLEAAGRVPGRRVLQIEERTATREEAAHLKVAKVCVCHGLALADDQPLALFQAAFGDLRMAQTLREENSVTRALARLGVVDYERAQTEVSAVAADAAQALHLGIKEGEPLLLTTSVNVTPEGRPIEFGRTWFAGDRISLSIAAQ